MVADAASGRLSFIAYQPSTDDDRLITYDIGTGSTTVVVSGLGFFNLAYLDGVVVPALSGGFLALLSGLMALYGYSAIRNRGPAVAHHQQVSFQERSSSSDYR
jgi:hypothetical protein